MQISRGYSTGQKAGMEIWKFDIKNCIRVHHIKWKSTANKFYSVACVRTWNCGHKFIARLHAEKLTSFSLNFTEKLNSRVALTLLLATCNCACATHSTFCVPLLVWLLRALKFNCICCRWKVLSWQRVRVQSTLWYLCF